MFVSCPCSSCVQSSSPHRFSLESLLKRKERGVPKIPCEFSFEEVELFSLVEFWNYIPKKPWEEKIRESSPMPIIRKEPSPPEAKELTPEPSPQGIYVSYSWKEESRKLVDDLEEVFREKEIPLLRDINELPYKGRIKEFMRRLGKGQTVIVILSEAYLMSENCMFELVEIYKNQDFFQRIFPVVMPDAKIFKLVERLRYVKHWEEEIKELNQAMKKVEGANLQGIYEGINTYTEIRQHIAQLMEWLGDMNLKSVEHHQQTKYRDLIQAIHNNKLL